ncbi:MAG TPA: MCP four helix bundle domain-containing protein [Syntrophales bacterium]|nr:MCP four helix bundle domain-containing protein [Syntrophales bacterium]HPQ42712.1 MCP four helix bundle domain-containing protein [Syntrophales bacterium]
MGIRIKILSGFLILSTMLLVAGVWSIYELSTIGISVQKILDENYKSVNAAKSMIEALEREDSGILLLLLGKREEGRTIINSADESFRKAYETARSNITIPGEKGYVDEIMNTYDTYRNLWRQSVVGTAREGDLNWYLREVHSAFLKVKLTTQDLMTLNDKTMYRTASNLESRGHRATMPGIIAVVSAFIFAIIFSFLINLFIVNPIIRLTDGIQDYLDSGKQLDVKVETKDELADLVSSVENLIARSKA